MPPEERLPDTNVKLARVNPVLMNGYLYAMPGHLHSCALLATVLLAASSENDNNASRGRAGSVPLNSGRRCGCVSFGGARRQPVHLGELIEPSTYLNRASAVSSTANCQCNSPNR